MKRWGRIAVVLMACSAIAFACAACGGGGGGDDGGGDGSGLVIVSVAGTDEYCYEGATFVILVTVNNPTSGTVSYTLRHGTTFYPDQGGYQALIVIQDFTVSVGAGTHTFCVPVFCLDVSLSAPAGGNTFTVGGAPGTACLDEIMSLVSGKRLDGLSMLTIQFIVWECMETGAISQESRNALVALPAA